MAMLRLPSVYKRLAAFSNRFRKRRAESNVKRCLSEQNSVSSTSTRPSSAALESRSDHGDERHDQDPTPNRLSLINTTRPPTKSAHRPIVAEITESPSEAGAEVSLSSRRRSDALLRLASLALSRVSGSADKNTEVEKPKAAKKACNKDLHDVVVSPPFDVGTLAQQPTLPLTQTDTGISTVGRDGPEIFVPSNDQLLSNLLPGKRKEEPVAHTRNNGYPVPNGKTLKAARTESNDFLVTPLGESNCLETATLADSLTSDEDSVGSTELNHLGDQLPVQVSIEADKVPPDMINSCELQMAEAEELMKGELNISDDHGKPEGPMLRDPFLYLRQIKKRLDRQPRAAEDLDILGCEIKYEHRNDAVALARHTSALSTASSILIDHGHVARGNRARSVANITDNCDCLGAGNYEDGTQSIEYSQGSSILTDEEGDEFSEESVPTCYVCLPSERRGSIWQDLK